MVPCLCLSLLIPSVPTTTGHPRSAGRVQVLLPSSVLKPPHGNYTCVAHRMAGALHFSSPIWKDELVCFENGKAALAARSWLRIPPPGRATLTVVDQDKIRPLWNHVSTQTKAQTLSKVEI